MPLSDVVAAETGEGEAKNENKSEISLVHEIALKRNMAVNFEVLGPFLKRKVLLQLPIYSLCLAIDS